jgi:alkylhydroperoxidase family enzyme
VAAWRDAPYFSDAERAALALAEATTRLTAGYGWAVTGVAAAPAYSWAARQQYQATMLR